MSALDLPALQELAIDIALGAGRLQLEGLATRPAVDRKSQRELVTPVDQACEDYVVARLQEAVPEHGVYAEEGHRSEGSCRWIVDPIDGTTNYAQLLPAFCVALGLEAPGEGCVLGVVYAPRLDELFYAHAGGGAFLRQGGQTRPLRVSGVDTMADALLASGFAYVRNQTPNHNLDNWRAVSLACRGLRRNGSAQLDLAYVADGRFEAFWEMHLKPWDVAAGSVLIREAGGRVTDMFLGEDWLEGQSVIASNGQLHEELHALLQPPQADGWVRTPA